MSFIAQDFDSLKILAILDGRTQAIIRNHFLRYSRTVRNRVKVITMDMFNPYDKPTKLPRSPIFKLRLKQSQTVSLPNVKIVLNRFHPSLLNVLARD